MFLLFGECHVNKGQLFLNESTLPFKIVGPIAKNVCFKLVVQVIKSKLFWSIYFYFLPLIVLSTTTFFKITTYSSYASIE